MDFGNIASKVASIPKVQDFLKNMVFPVGKQNIVDKARQTGMDNNIMSMLQKLPDKQYQSESDVKDELNKIK